MNMVQITVWDMNGVHEWRCILKKMNFGSLLLFQQNKFSIHHFSEWWFILILISCQEKVWTWFNVINNFELWSEKYWTKAQKNIEPCSLFFLLLNQKKIVCLFMIFLISSINIFLVENDFEPTLNMVQYFPEFCSNNNQNGFRKAYGASTYGKKVNKKVLLCYVLSLYSPNSSMVLSIFSAVVLLLCGSL